MIDRETLEKKFRYLGLGEGDRVVVHSSLRSIGPVDGGAETVVAALIGLLGPNGLLAAPTFNFRVTRFDPDETPSRMGRITEVVRTWPGAVRSWHPTHSVTAIGADAEALCAGHHLVGGLSVDSPLDRLAFSGGWVLLIGVGHNRNSSIHIGEARAPTPWLRREPVEGTLTVRGREATIPLLEPPGCSEAFGAAEGELRRRGAIRDGEIGQASAQLMRGRDLIETVIDLMRDDPALFLCTNPACPRCSTARASTSFPI
jgi:aminoglycoside 3-N-acetyltransferase